MTRYPGVDAGNISMIGNANTSSQIITYVSRNRRVSSVVSLEGGLLSSYEQRLLRETAFYKTRQVEVPILAIYAPHPSIDPTHIFHLKYANRYFIHFPQMTEFHCLNYGMFEQFVPGIIGNHEGDVQGGFEWISRSILSFLKAHSTSSDDQTEWQMVELAEAEGHIDTTFVLESEPIPPSTTILKNGFTKRGFAYVDSVHAQHSAPYTLDEYVQLRDWLAWQKDPDFTYRYQLYTLAANNFEESPEVHYYLAYYAQEMENSNQAKRHARRALTLLNEDADPALTIGRADHLRTALDDIMTNY